MTTAVQYWWMPLCAVAVLNVAAWYLSAALLKLVPLIFIAESGSWYAILSTDYVGQFVENSIWTFAATLLLASFVLLWPRSGR